MPIDSLRLQTSCYTVNGRKFEVPHRYRLVKPVGQAAHSAACLARDVVTGEECSIRKVEDVFEHLTAARRTLRELRLLRHLRHENVMDVMSIFLPGSKRDFEDLYVVSEVKDTDLASVLRSKHTLSDEQNQFLLYQTLRGMKYVHSAGVVHGYLEPGSLLVNAACELRVCDFGLAKVSFEDKRLQTCPMTEYVSKRWYRAPEVLCSWVNYDSAIDVWSIGCVFAEMLLRRPLFPGDNAQHLLKLVVALLGTPSSEEQDAIPSESCRRFVGSLPHSEGRCREAFAGASEEAFDLLRSMLQFSPRSRVTVPQALERPYLDQFSCPEDEPTRGALEASDFEFERRRVDARALREELFQEALHYHPHTRDQYVREQRRLGRQRYSPKTCPLFPAPGEPLYSGGEEEGEVGQRSTGSSRESSDAQAVA
uniref:Protein kinase domain-containing protein n=1 Tax=Alexandrium monilatum TaxID=311494 RepID=A0A7S4SRZ8_9DINO